MSTKTFGRGQIVTFSSCTFDQTSPILMGLVISQKELFDMSGLALVVPVVEMEDVSRYGGFAVNLQQPNNPNMYAIASKQKSLDLPARFANTPETVSEEVVEEVLARILAMMNV